MKVDNQIVIFENADMHFIKKYGIQVATDMVLNYTAVNNTPFIHDFYQFASFLCMKPSWIRKVLEDIASNYVHLEIPKKSGGTRDINHPIGRLAYMQKKIYKGILCRFRPSPYATAYRRGTHLTDNATPHVRKRYLLKMDITDFFGYIRFDMILSSVFNSSLYPTHIGTMLTALCCFDDALPHGACTSPAISNIVMKHFDDTFGAWCSRRGFSYTRYSDDITVSGNDPLYPAYCVAKDMLTKMGFELNEHKTHFITNASKQTVTGLTVNEKVNVNVDYKQELRQELYYAIKFGIPSVVDRQKMKQYIVPSNPLKGYISYYTNLMGRLDYVLSIEPDNDYFIDAKKELREQRFGKGNNL